LRSVPEGAAGDESRIVIISRRRRQRVHDRDPRL